MNDVKVKMVSITKVEYVVQLHNGLHWADQIDVKIFDLECGKIIKNNYMNEFREYRWRLVERTITDKVIE